MKVFLGGTCNESNWRNRIITMLEVGFFNPVVDDWTPDCMAEELRQREECDVCLYVITPRMTGVYSIAEVIDDSNKRPARTVFVRLRDDGDEKFTDGQWKSLGAVAQMVERNGGAAFDDLKSAALWINSKTPKRRVRAMVHFLARLRNALCFPRRATTAAQHCVETQHHQRDPEECRTYRGLAGTDGNNAVLPQLPPGVPSIYEPSAPQEADAAWRNTHAKEI